MDRWEREIAERRRLADEVIARMNLGQAVGLIRHIGPWGCACSGPPCCVDWNTQAHALHRAAHIVVKQLDGLRAHPPD